MGSTIPRGIFLEGSTIHNLYADSAVIHGNVMLSDGFLSVGSIRFNAARITGLLNFNNASLTGSSEILLNLNSATIGETVFFQRGFRATGEISMIGARIEGSVEMVGARLDPCGQDAFSADFATISGALRMHQGFECNGAIRLPGARIGNIFSCAGARIDTRYKTALFCRDAVFGGSIFLHQGFSCRGRINFYGAQIGNDLILTGAKLDGKESEALIVDSAEISGNLHLDDSFEAHGQVSVGGAIIHGSLSCRESRIFNPHGKTLSIDSTIIHGDLILGPSFVSSGELSMIGAEIRGDVNAPGGTFEQGAGDAISADRARVDKDIFFRDGFSILGTLRMHSIHVCGSVAFVDGVISRYSGDAILADGARIGGDLIMGGGRHFACAGSIRLCGTSIGRDLDCRGSRYRFGQETTLIAEGMTVGGAWAFMELDGPVDNVNVASARTGRLADDDQAWGEQLIIDGFIYDALTGGAPTSASTRLRWIDRQRNGMNGHSHEEADFRPQPWRQLQKVLREMGHAEDARQIAIAFEDRLREADLIGQSPTHWGLIRRGLYRRLARAFHLGFRMLTGYGYRPMRLMFWMLGIWLTCAGFYWYAALPPRSVFAPSNPLVFQNAAYEACRARTPKINTGASENSPTTGTGNWYLCTKLQEEYTGFSPLAYSLDVVLPLVDLQQQTDWAPMIPAPSANIAKELSRLSVKHLTRLVVWFETLFGWLASLLLVAIVSGLTKRRED